jgi:hypothetical protein
VKISERCVIKTEMGTGTDSEEGAHTSTSGEIGIGSASVSNTNVDSGSIAFGSSAEEKVGDSGSFTVDSVNAQQQSGSIAMASLSIKGKVIVPRRSKRIPEGLCDQMLANEDSSVAIRSKDIDNSTEKGVTRKSNAEDASNKSRKKGTAAITYKRIQQGLTPKRNLTQDQIERLEEIGF